MVTKDLGEKVGILVTRYKEEGGFSSWGSCRLLVCVYVCVCVCVRMCACVHAHATESEKDKAYCAQ